IVLAVLGGGGLRANAPLFAEARDVVPSATRALGNLGPSVAVGGHVASTYTLEERMRFYGVPGVSIAIINEGRIESVIAAGLRDVTSGASADTTTLFQAGSISQAITALTTLRLAEQGRIDMDGDVNRHLERWKLPASAFTIAEKVTPRRILSHTAGLTGWDLPAYALGAPVPSLPEILS